MFRVPRQPVREAFIKLVEADLLHVRPQRGTYIKPISMSRLREALFVREAVECAVIRLAAEQVTMKQ
ncbi:regulatory GntR family protein [Paraburkholderia fungorum]|nr:regulatory GntR family protein [Paraburkholderia fungorum]